MARTVLITGASAGIGAELGVQYASAGFNVALVARRKENLESVRQKCLAVAPKAKVGIYVGDVRERAQMEACARQAKSDFGSLDVVIANAGYSVAGRVLLLKDEDYQRQFDTNIYGVFNTLHATIGSLKQSKGSFVVIGSINSYISIPGHSAYCMSKAAIRAWSICLHEELKKDGVAVTLICPGIVASEILQIDNQGKFHADWSDPRPKALIVPTDRAAREIRRAIARRKKEAVVTGHGKVLVWLQRHFPWVVTLVAKERRRNSMPDASLGGAH